MLQVIHSLLGFSFLLFLNETYYDISNHFPSSDFAFSHKSLLVALSFAVIPPRHSVNSEPRYLEVST